jgi:hypothetical protein
VGRRANESLRLHGDHDRRPLDSHKYCHDRDLIHVIRGYPPPADRIPRLQEDPEFAEIPLRCLQLQAHWVTTVVSVFSESLSLRLKILGLS